MTNVGPVRLPSIPADLPRLPGTGISSEVLDRPTKLIKIAGMDNNLIGLTNKGHVLRFDMLDGEDSYQQGHWEYVSQIASRMDVLSLIPSRSFRTSAKSKKCESTVRIRTAH